MTIGHLKSRNQPTKILDLAPSRVVMATLQQVSAAVGVTLGPAGRPVLLERQEQGLPPYLTKDGVTVYRALGFADPVADACMELVRDSAVRTANEAGDGPQPLWSKVLTLDGFVNMSDVRVGMEICGSKGTVQKVVGVYPKGPKRLVRITFEGGREVECCEEHLWTVTTNYGVEKTLTTAEMMKDYVKYTSGGRSFRYYVQKAGPVAGRIVEGPLDPYTLGVLIGDGSLSDSGSVELSLGKAKEHIIAKLRFPLGISMNPVWVPSDNVFRVKITGKDEDGRSIRELLEQIGLRNSDSYTKFIPKNYLLGAIPQRQAILQGLIDTDGYKNQHGRFEYSTVSDQLAKDFKSLCYGLGISLWYGLHTRDNDPDSYSDNPIHRFTELKGNRFGDKIVKIEITDVSVQMQCIKVDGDDHLYVTDNYILTHNTTTATVLAAALVDNVQKYCAAHPEVAPQLLTRQLIETIRTVGIPYLQERAVAARMFDDAGKEDPEGIALLHGVAKVSANWDVPLADAVVETMRIAGDWGGNVVIHEVEGDGGYQVTKVAGYSLSTGWEDSCRNLWPNWITHQSTQTCEVARPRVLCFNGRVSQWSTIRPLFQRMDQELTAFADGNTPALLGIAVREGWLPAPKCSDKVADPKNKAKSIVCNKPLSDQEGTWACDDGHICSDILRQLDATAAAAFDRYQQSLGLNVVIVATGFSDQVLTDMFVMFRDPDKLKLIPVVAPLGPTPGHQGQLLFDLAAVAGARVLDAVAISTGKFRLADLGPGVTSVEVSRTRSNFVGCAYEHAHYRAQGDELLSQLAGRVQVVRTQSERAASTLDRVHVLDRLAKLTGGLASLTVRGSSNGELRERRDRAEDAVCAARGALRSGCLPGGGWGLLRMGLHLAIDTADSDPVVSVLFASLQEPLRRILSNAGFTTAQIDEVVQGYVERADQAAPEVFDVITRKWVDPFAAGLLDSAPAVLEAVRSAASIALSAGTLGAIVAFARDPEAERREAAAAQAYRRAASQPEEINEHA